MSSFRLDDRRTARKSAKNQPLTLRTVGRKLPKSLTNLTISAVASVSRKRITFDMRGTPEPAAEELLPKYAELVRLLQMEKPERFAELARTFNADDDLEDARKNHFYRHQYAGKILCATRTTWKNLKQQGRNRHQTFPDYFESQTGCRPSDHGQSCAKTYRTMVLTGIIAESDYDKNSSEAIQTTSRVIFKVEDEMNHPAVAEAASILRQRSRSAIRELKALLDRLIKDPVTGQVKLLDKAQAAELDIRPLSYAPALELAFKIAKEGHHSVLAAPLKEIAASTSKLEEARSLAMAAAKILACLSNNRDERGKRRFSDEAIAAWSIQDGPIAIVTDQSLRADYAAAKRRVQEIENKLNEAGIVPNLPPTLPQPASPDATPKIAGQGIALKRWRGAEQQVLALLAARGWRVEDVSQQNIGYDIEGLTPENEEVFVEVKAIEHPSQPFTLTSNEEAVGRQKGKAYRLAVVRQTSDHLEVSFIEDPIHNLKLTRQCRQWVWVCAAYAFAPERYALE